MPLNSKPWLQLAAAGRTLPRGVTFTDLLPLLPPRLLPAGRSRLRTR